MRKEKKGKLSNGRKKKEFCTRFHERIGVRQRSACHRDKCNGHCSMLTCKWASRLMQAEFFLYEIKGASYVTRERFYLFGFDCCWSRETFVFGQMQVQSEKCRENLIGFKGIIKLYLSFVCVCLCVRVTCQLGMKCCNSSDVEYSRIEKSKAATLSCSPNCVCGNAFDWRSAESRSDEIVSRSAPTSCALFCYTRAVFLCEMSIVHLGPKRHANAAAWFSGRCVKCRWTRATSCYWHIRSYVVLLQLTSFIFG